ncbi:hypothetical protein GCM10028805_51600 [Spirosoma harenae]
MVSTSAIEPESNLIYPPAPTLPDTGFLDPSPAFRQHVLRTLLGIVGFAILYLCLIGFGLGLAYGCVLSTIWLISVSINKLTIIIGLGLLALGIMFLLFLVKFLFAVYKNQDAQRVEITAKDHPRLFTFIHRLTEEVNAPKPYKIYLSPNVNACVFYNSSFWSLFLPVRKNLEIGLGLVNSLNISEFKAVMAHEFGHFSQRSMKLGSYVYIVNRVIYNLVYERDRWDALLDRWASSGGLWGIFAGFTHILVNLVRRILSKAYQWLNLRYMGLSREMEYQADLVAVSAAGGQPIITALRRIELGDAAYRQTLNYLNGLVDQAKIAQNLYPLHTETMQMLASENEIEIVNGLAILTDEHALKIASPNRVNYQDQWSSHPSQSEREQNIQSVLAPCTPDESSPWSLFNKPEHWQQELTAQLYVGVELSEGAAKQFINPTDYRAYVIDQNQRAQLPERYNGFYDRRLLHTFDPVLVADSAESIPDADTIFSDENRRLRKRLFTNYEDQTTLEQIKTRQIQTRTFDFDGKKYDWKNVDLVLNQLNPEIEALQKGFEQAEEDAFRWHYQKAKAQGVGNELISRYQLYFSLDADRESYLQLISGYGKLVKNTYDAVKDGGTLKRGMGGQIDEQNEKIQQAYSHSQTIDVPEKLGEHEFKHGYAAYLFEEEPQNIHGDSFNWEHMVALYRQLEEIPQRAAHVQIIVLQELIRWQAAL